MKYWGRVASIVACLLLLLWLDGWLAIGPAAPRAGSAPPDLRDAFARAAADLAARAQSFSQKPEIARSLRGGGIVVNRTDLFSAARQSMEGSCPGCWIALTDAAGNVHAWWGEAPSPVPRPAAAEGFSTLWSVTSLTLVYRHSLGVGSQEGIVSAARSFPVRAPDFAAALGLGGERAFWRATGKRAAPPLFRDGQAFVAVEPAPSASEGPPGKAAAAAILVAAALVLFTA
ncbi:MAG TPA: hypothetical protein VEG84_09445, partial [Thermoanaerobaculia bacterium]|nr:hypothetical protein [Thermoanaerobaculia bacterium]